MKSKRYIEEQIIDNLQAHKAGSKVGSLELMCPTMPVNFHPTANWREELRNNIVTT